MKVVLDTNTWLSAIVWRGEATKIIEAGLNKKIKIIISQEILSEIIDVLSQAKFKDFIDKEKIEDLIKVILSIAELIETKTRVDIIKEDPKDNIILECAVSCNADYIISGDQHLLKLKEFKGIKIITAKEFLDLTK